MKKKVKNNIFKTVKNPQFYWDEWMLCTTENWNAYFMS